MLTLEGFKKNEAMSNVYDDGNAFVKAEVHTARKLNVFRIIARPRKIQQ